MFTYNFQIYEKSATTTVKAESLVETFKIDESLDSGLVVIPRIARSTPFSRFAPVKITISDGNTEKIHWWLIYTPKVELVVPYPTAKYDHTLGLIEPTKWLDKFACGTLTFTQPLGGTRYTLADVVDRLRLLTPFVPYASVSTTRLFTVDSDLHTYLDTIPAPQLYFDKKNLREALIETFQYVNAIPRLDYNGTTWTLTADFVNKRNLPFTLEKVIDFGDEASGENYAHKAEMYHENTITNEDEDVTSVYASSVSNYVSFRGSDIIVGDSNYKLILTNKVYKLLSVKMYLTLSPTPATTFAATELDITEFIYEKKVFDTLDFNNSKGNKPFAAYWTYGSNEIDGFSETYTPFLTVQAFENIRDQAVTDQASPTLSSNSKWDQVAFLVEYIPYIEQMKSEQYREERDEFELQANMIDRYSTLQINPQERINALFQLTKNAYGQIQRLGVDTVSFTRKHKALTTYSGDNQGIYSLGDYTDDGYYITNKEIVYFNDFVIGRYEMSKNFNRIAQFVNIDKEFRPYEISLNKSDFTLRRNIVMPFQTIEIDNNDTANDGSPFIVPFMLTFQSGTSSIPVSSAVLRYGVSTPSESYEDEGSLLPLVLSGEKNTFKFKIDLQDTKLAGKRIVGETTLVGTINYYKQLQVPYTEADGTAELYKIELYNDYWNIIAQTNVADSYYQSSVVGLSKTLPYVNTTHNVALGGVALGESLVAEEHDDLAEIISQGSAINGNYYIALDTYNVYQYDEGTTTYILVDKAVAVKNNPFNTLPTYQVLKDTSEILSFELSMPVIVNKDKVNRYVIGDELIQNNVLIKNRSVGLTLYWYVQDEMFSKAETKTIGQTSTSAVSSTITISNNRITVPTAVLNTNKNFALADENGILYIGVNRINLDGTVEASANVQYIYFNFTDERS